jgi:N4-gp56 family major capsid protein
MSGQVWGVDALGGYMYSDQLSDYLRTELQPLSRFRQFCDIKEGKGEGKGEKFNWNVYSDVQTDGAALTETNAMPETNYTISQGTLTVTEYGNSVPYTKKLDDLSKQPVKEIINKVLKNDARKSLDRAAYAQFDSTRVTLAPTGGNSATAVTLETGAVGAESSITNNAAMTKAHIKTIADLMKERDITPYFQDDYFSIARPTTLRPFKNELEAIKQYTETGMQLIYNGETGRYEGIRFVEQTNVPTKAWSNALSDEAFFFGADTVAEAIVEPEQIRGKIPTDFGRSRAIAWYYLGGFGISHNAAGGVQNRILKWSSAA